VIKLKTMIEVLQLNAAMGELSNVEHDALVAHAYQEAVEERIAEYEKGRAYDGDVLTNAAIKSLRQFHERAAEKLKEWGVE
jgi:hypothetical protein